MPEWTRTVNSRVPGTDIGKAICEDDLGNVIVLGELKQYSAKGTEIILKKFNPTGNLLWEVNYHNPFGENDLAVDVATDSSENVYALLNSYITSDSNPDILLQKYSSTGQLVWEAVYNGTGTLEDAGLELHVDPSGFSTICGTSQSSQNDKEILIARYDAGGSLIFQNLRTHPTGGWQQVQDMVIGSNGDVFVAGSNGVNGGASNNDLCIYQVNSAGNIVWDTTYLPRLNMPGTIRAVEIDLSLTGGPVLYSSERNGLEVEFRLLAFDLNGNEIASNAIFFPNGVSVYPYAMGVGPDGNVYLSYQTRDSLWFEIKRLWKCTPLLQTIWDRGIDHTYGVLPEVRHTMKFRPNGNLVLAGTRSQDSAYNYHAADLMAMELDTSGFKIREDEWNGPGDGTEVLTDFFLSDAGEALLAGQAIIGPSNRDLVGGKLDLAALNDWFQSDGGLVNGDEHYLGVKSDASGNIYLGGRTWGNNSLPGFRLAKYDPAGTLLLDSLYSSPFDRSFWAMDMDVDPAGNIAMIAHGSLPNGNSGIYLEKIGANGQILWWDTLHTDLTAATYTARTVAFDGSGHIYIGVNYRLSSFKEYWHVAKYGANGNRIWGRDILPLNSGSIYGYCDVTKIIPDGNDVWIGGQLDGNLAYRKLDPNGNIISSLEHFSTTSNAYADLIIDPSGNPILSGRGESSMVGGYHWGTYKFDPSGNLLWQDLIPGNVFASADPEAVATDAAGNIYVCGRTGYYKYSVAKYDPNGTLIWKQDYGNGTYAQRVGAKALLPGPGGGMVSCGLNGGLPAQMRVVNTNPGGWANWSYDYAGPGSESTGLGMVKGLGGEVYVAGYVQNDTNGKDLILLKFDQLTAREEGLGATDLVLYPNPAQNMINVEWDGVLNSEEVQVRVVDLHGRIVIGNTLVFNSVSGVSSTGNSAGNSNGHSLSSEKGRVPVDISVLRPGMYFMQLENDLGENTQAKFLVR